MQTTEPVCTVKTKEETKRGQTGRHLEKNVLEITLTKKKKKENQNNTEEIFGPTPATVESSQ